ncbi:MAG: precorrin-3B C(17)-methyltransferase [Leptolyngbyaceae bacterium]|nr:precorrin-3B C(17)-methyltransferase [Leptolyngbyaceae bacterium]
MPTTSEQPSNNRTAPLKTKPITIIAPTPTGYRLGLSLRDSIGAQTLWTRDTTLDTDPRRINVNTYSGAITTVVAVCWSECSQLVFVLTVGAVVRLIAPLLSQKTDDPGVVVIDETGTFVISLSGGHQGGADALARECAAILGVTPVITSASTGKNLPALDCLGTPYGWQRGTGDWTAVATAMTQDQPIHVTQTCGSTLWHQTLPANHPFVFTDSPSPTPPLPHLYISDHQSPTTDTPTISWHPRTLWIGLGCERNTAVELIETSLRQLMQDQGLVWEAIAGIATIDIKQDELAFQDLAQRYQWPIRYFTADQLQTQPVPTPSTVVAQSVGTPSVAEAAALLATSSSQNPKSEIQNTDTDSLVVPKQVFKSDQGACTMAIARAQQEYNPRPGHLYLIGSGPGSLGQLTAAARIALLRCDVIMGYGLYLDLLRPLLHANQVIETSQITQEVQRAERAVTLAQQGLTVGMVSSGDCGIYGMAGLVLEWLAQGQWDGHSPSVEVLPGITALQAIAARVGAPLMHDFCAISLSDLLTPWSVIEQRLTAAAQADFVVALYNPRSKTRIKGIEIALEIMQKWRSPQTPVAIARSLYREGESVSCLTLAEVDVTTIDMLTVVLIGNASTFLHEGKMITPRGYMSKGVGA